MKDIQSSSKHSARNQVYPRRRPSPYGITKSQKPSPLYPPLLTTRKSPRTSRAEQLARKERDAQIARLRREGVYLEEEYRDDIRQYMYEMEVSCLSFFITPPSPLILLAALHNVFGSVNGSAT